MKRLVIALMLVATPATAQRVECFKTGAQTICETRPDGSSAQRDHDRMMRDLEAQNRESRERNAANPSRCARGDWLLAGCTWGEHKDAKEQVEVRKRVGDMLLAGDCRGAMASAIASGDHDLANQVLSACRR